MNFGNDGDYVNCDRQHLLVQITTYEFSRFWTNSFRFTFLYILYFVVWTILQLFAHSN
jgi:hypothetical protein